MISRLPEDTIHRLLAEHLGAPMLSVEKAPRDDWEEADVLYDTPDGPVVMQIKTAGSTEAVGRALLALQATVGAGHDAIPLVVVPYMGEVGKELCRRAGIGWMDLSGNASITTPRHRIHVEGRPNRFAARGRPSDPFAPKASRITRTLLLNSKTVFSQTDLVGITGLDKGFVSRIVKRLTAAGLVERDSERAIRVPDPAGLLAAWRASYDFHAHEVIRAVVPARSGPDVVARVDSALRGRDVRYAVTGLAAAWSYVPFATYRTAAIYVSRRPSDVALKEMGAAELAPGANLWLVIPNDEGVFDRCDDGAGVPRVSALQTYLDLKGQPERAEEAAVELRRACLPWADE